MHPQSLRLRAIAALLDFLAVAGLGEEAVPIDGNDSLEISETAHAFCMGSPQGRQMLADLEETGCFVCQYDNESWDCIADYDLAFIKAIRTLRI